MDKNKKVDFVRIRVSKQERERVEQVMALTHQKRSEIYRAAIYHYIKINHPEILDY
jgi:predicted transcriptional regulator